jgi:malate synthase
LQNGKTTSVAKANMFAGYLGKKGAPDSIMLRHKRLGIEILIDDLDDRQVGCRQYIRRLAGIGADDHQDCEDSVAAVDAEDKVSSIATGSA